MEEQQVFNALYALIKKEENYIPRNYQTIGGMWTTDTWKLDGITLQIMDEGYTQRIFKLGVFDVIQGYRFGKNEIEFKQGNLEDLKNSLQTNSIVI